MTSRPEKDEPAREIGVHPGCDETINALREHRDALLAKSKLLVMAGQGLLHTLARYHDKNENHYIGLDDKEQRCEGCGAIEFWEKALEDFRGK